MRRRDFLLSATATICGARLRAAGQQKEPERWRVFEVTTHVHVQHAAGTTRVWLPTPVAVAPYQKTLGDTYHIDGGAAQMVEREGIDMLAALWPDGIDPVLTLTSRVATAEYDVDFATPRVPPPRDLSAFSPYLRAPRNPPIDDAAIKSTVASLTHGAGTDLDRARAIFDWTVAQDRNDWFVALARSAGVPTRPVYGLRVSEPDATRAQVDRAEVYLVGYGWTPVDTRDRRFGSWDVQWIAYNSAQDLTLPGAMRGTLPYFMHPQGETDKRRIDGRDAEGFRYTISAVEIG